MKRWISLGIFILSLLFLYSLSRTAIDPTDFSGNWYSPVDQSVYTFQEGIIRCEKHSITMSNTEPFSGAYTYCKNTIVLFAEGIAGLETVQELYLVQNGKESLLCEKEDGSGTVFFVREEK